MVTIIKDIESPYMKYIKDDPVRPEISMDFRVGKNRFISVMGEEKPSAIVCVCLLDHVPVKVEELEMEEDITTAVFYTIWSYVPGAGAKLLIETVKLIKEQFPTVKRFVTLSPKTEMAKRFHLKNGAIVLNDNEESVNYEYRGL